MVNSPIIGSGRFHILECGQIVATAWTLAEACRLAREAWDGETMGDGAPSLYDTETGEWIAYDEVARPAPPGA